MGQISSIGAGSGRAWESLPREVMEHRVATAQLLIGRSVLAATWQAYSKVWLEWDVLVREVGDGVCDASRVHLLLYFIG